MFATPRGKPPLKGVFSPNTPLIYERARFAPYTSSHMSGHHPATVRRAGRKRGARFESSEALAEQPAVGCAVPWSCIDAAPGCLVLRRSSVNILAAWPGRVAQAPRAGRSRTPCPAHHVGARVEKRTVGGSARARRRSELANRRRRCHRQPPSRWHLRRRFANFQRQRGPAGPPIYVFRANAPFTWLSPSLSH